MRLLLVRHGQSICGVNGVVGGARGCTGLTELGVEQARALRDRFKAEGFTADVLLGSTLPRAAQTAEVVGEALGLVPDLDPELVEHIPGDIDGSTWDDWRERHAFDLLSDFERPLSPNGESVNTFQARIAGRLTRFAEEHAGQTVVACCHGGVVSASLIALAKADLRAAWLDVDFTSITEWELRPAALGGEIRWHLRRFNDHAHLANVQ